jgi:hypothetical protein
MGLLDSMMRPDDIALDEKYIELYASSFDESVRLIQT